MIFKGDYENKNPIKLDSRMILPRESILYSGLKIYFSPVIKYTERLFKDADVPQDIRTFIDQNTFRKLLLAGAKKQDIPKYESNKSVDITKFNIEFMVKLLFKKGNDINIYWWFSIQKFQSKKI